VIRSPSAVALRDKEQHAGPHTGAKGEILSNTMSREYVELARQASEAFNRGGIPAMQEFWDPEVVWHTDPMVPEPGVYEGKEAVVAYLEGFIRAFGAWRVEVVDLVDLGGEDVLSVMTALGRPLGQTQQETQFLEWCHISTVRNNKVIRIRSFLDKGRAFEAAGLSAQDVRAES
jgi:ketosteroid isomerase-like protein